MEPREQPRERAEREPRESRERAEAEPRPGAARHRRAAHLRVRPLARPRAAQAPRPRPPPPKTRPQPRRSPARVQARGGGRGGAAPRGAGDSLPHRRRRGASRRRPRGGGATRRLHRQPRRRGPRGWWSGPASSSPAAGPFVALGDAYLWLSPFCTNFHAPPAEAWPLSWWQGPFREGVKSIGKARRALTESSGGRGVGRSAAWERGIGGGALPAVGGAARTHARMVRLAAAHRPRRRGARYGEIWREMCPPPSPPRWVLPPVRPLDQRTLATRPRHVRDTSETRRCSGAALGGLLRGGGGAAARGAETRRDSPRFAEIQPERGRGEREKKLAAARAVADECASLTRP